MAEAEVGSVTVNDRLASVQAGEQKLAAVTAQLSAAEAQHNDQLSENAGVTTGSEGVEESWGG